MQIMSEAKPSASLSGGLLARKGGARPAMRRPSAIQAEDAIESGQDDLGWNDMGYDVNPAPETPMDHKHAQFNPLAAAVPEATPEVKKQQDRIAAQLQAQPITDYPKEAIGVPENAAALSIGGMWLPEAEEDEASAEAEEIEAVEQADDIENTVGDAEADNAAPANATIAVEAQPELNIAAKQPVIQEEAPVRSPKKRAAPGSKAKAAFTLRLDKERHLKLRLATAVSNKSAQKIVTEALDRMLEDMPEIKSLAANIATNK